MKILLAIAAIALNLNISMAQVNWNANPTGAVFARQGGDSPEGTFRLTSDGFEVYTLVCADKSFQPASLYYGKNDADKAKVDAMAPDGKVPTSMNCFLVNTPDGYIMFDTGLPSSRGGLTLARLASLGVSPADIKAIFVTHGHFDHIGGLLDDNAAAAFPNAQLYIPADELAFITETMADATRQITQAYDGRITTFAPGEILPGGVLPVAAKGHTPGHTAYLLGKLFFVGDIMHGISIQLIDPTISASFDADPAQAVATRRSILSFAVARSLTVLGAHAPLNGIIF